MRSFKEFIEKDIAVTFNDEKELEEFYKLCLLNKAVDSHTIMRNKKDSLNNVVYFSKHYSRVLVNFGGFLDYKKVPASEFLQQQTTIEIFQAKQTVVSLKKQDGKVIARGVSRCSKDDVFNFDIGATIAFKRMLVDSKNKELIKDFEVPKSDSIQCDFTDAAPVEIKMLKDGTKIIKQDNYEVGDKVIFKRKSRPKAFSTKVTITSVKGELFKCSHVSAWLHKGRIKGKVIE